MTITIDDARVLLDQVIEQGIATTRADFTIGKNGGRLTDEQLEEMLVEVRQSLTRWRNDRLVEIDRFLKHPDAAGLALN